MHKKHEDFISLFSSFVSTFVAQGEYDDIEEVGRHLVETTSLMRDGLKIQTKYKHVLSRPPTNDSAEMDSQMAGRLATIPRDQSVNGEEVQGLDVYFVFDVSKSIHMSKTHVEAIDFAKAFVEKVYRFNLITFVNK